MKSFKLGFPVFLSLILCAACTNRIDVKHIESTEWMYNNGYNAADLLRFDSSNLCSIKKDTLFVDGQPRALIINLDKKANDLTVRSLDGKKEGHYIDEWETGE
jgi:hypothetical protein